MTKRRVSDVTIEMVTGDITAQPDLDVVVNAANAQLAPGGGVAGAIHKAAGPDLAEECAPLGPIQVGQAVITGGHNLPNEHVIHCLGPVYGSDEPAAELLASCYRNALRLAEEHRLGSIGFPALSTGIFGYPMEAAAEIAATTIIQAADGLASVDLVRFVLFSPDDLAVHSAVLHRSLD